MSIKCSKPATVATKGKFVRDEKGEIVCHRVWFKILFNPILRKIGFVIVSIIDTETEMLEGYGIRRYPF